MDRHDYRFKIYPLTPVDGLPSSPKAAALSSRPDTEAKESRSTQDSAESRGYH